MFDEAIFSGGGLHLACSHADQRFCHHTLKNSPPPLGLDVCVYKPGLSKAHADSASSWLLESLTLEIPVSPWPIFCPLHASPRSDTPLPRQKLDLTLEPFCLLCCRGNMIAWRHGSQQLLTKPAVTPQFWSISHYMLYHTYFYSLFYSITHPECNFKCLSVH